MSSPTVNGPNGDGSKSLAKESKAGLLVTFVLFAAAQGLVDALSNVDLNGQTGWWVSLANAGVATALGFLTAWLKKNR
jgi:uncharacterized membrane protein HdeD (DUF308 family)